MVEKTIFIEVKKPVRGQWVFDLDMTDESFFEQIGQKQIHIYGGGGGIDQGYQKEYFKYRDCTNREYSDSKTNNDNVHQPKQESDGIKRGN